MVASNDPGLRVGFLGVGHMGRPMVDRLLAAGVDTTVWVRRAALRSELEEAGVHVGESAASVAAAADVVILCFFSDEQVREVVLGGGVLAAMRSGSVLVSHITGSPQLSTELQAAAPDGVTVLDVPISGTDDHIRRGELTLIVGGDVDVLDRIRPVLATYCNPILHVGALGDGQRVKLINNLLFTVNLRSALQAAALGESMGVPTADLARVVSECSGGSFAMNLLQHLPAEALATGARHYLVKDVGVIRDVADSMGIDLGELGDRAGWVFDDVSREC
jgi:3-hydroxyisobutyrate dehydrogenase-like beta-hydroxyacid dehydrogenase